MLCVQKNCRVESKKGGCSWEVQECLAGTVRLVSTSTADVHAALHACPLETRSPARQRAPLAVRASSHVRITARAEPRA